jgi:hypothetical protein
MRFYRKAEHVIALLDECPESIHEALRKLVRSCKNDIRRTGQMLFHDIGYAISLKQCDAVFCRHRAFDNERAMTSTNAPGKTKKSLSM